MALKALIGDTVLSKDNNIVSVDSLLPSGGVLGLYFSAHWCPPCRAFTPELAEWYNNIKLGPNGSKFEIVFVSCDSDEDSFSEYFAEMPWHALPFSDRETEVKHDACMVMACEQFLTLVRCYCSGDLKIKCILLIHKLYSSFLTVQVVDDASEIPLAFCMFRSYSCCTCNSKYSTDGAQYLQSLSNVLCPTRQHFYDHTTL